MMEPTKEEAIEYLKKVGSEFQIPIQYQFMALEQMLKFQKKKMLKELWGAYITAIKIFLIGRLNDLFEKLSMEDDLTLESGIKLCGKQIILTAKKFGIPKKNIKSFNKKMKN